MDISIVSPVTLTALARPVLIPGSVSTDQERRKNTLYFEKCRSNNVVFEPIVLETTGGFGLNAVKILNRIAAAKADGEDGLDITRARERIFTRISVTLQKAIGRSLRNRYPNFSPIYHAID